MKDKQYFGCDTETPMGNLKVLATNLEAVEVATFEGIVDFLTQRKYRASIMFSFNLRFDSEAILKTTNDLDFLTKLYHSGAAPEGVWFNDRIKVRWIGTKFLQICKSSKPQTGNQKPHYDCVRMYDIAQFYSGWSLDKVARKYLGDYKNPVDGHRLGSEKGYYESHREEVLEYCRKDAELALNAAMLMKETIETTPMAKGELSFNNPISQAKVSEMYVKKNYKYPGVSKKLDKSHFHAYLAYHGGIFSTLQRGVFNQKLYSYDINSAYPFQMQNLPQWANGRFVNIHTPEEIDSRYGWFECEFDCEWIPFQDFRTPYEITFKYKELEQQVKLNPKRIVYPSGKRKQWITKIEYEWLLKHGYPVKFLGGFVWEEMKNEYENPFSWCEDVYKRRMEIKENDAEDIKQYALKIVINGIYGKTAQAKRGFGSLTNFFYASYITAGTRLQLCDVVLQKPNSIVELATDSVLSLEPLSVRVTNKLGDWSFKEYTGGLLIGSGMRQLFTGDRFKTAARGLTDKTDWNMLKAMRENIHESFLYFAKERPIHLGEVLMHWHILSLEDLIVFKEIKKKLNVNTDRKRQWERLYENFGDFLDSEPMNSKPLKVEELI